MPKNIVVRSAQAGRVYEIKSNRIHTVALEQYRGPVRHPIRGPEFALLLDGRKIGSSELSAQEIIPDPASPPHSRIEVVLRHPEKNLTARLVVAGDTGAGVLRKWLEITGAGHLEAVELECWQPVPDKSGVKGQKAGGLAGQPLYWQGYFFGIEHPAAENFVTAEGCCCAIPCAVTLSERPYVTEKLVFGAGVPGLEQEAFWDYLETIMAHPPRLVTLTNNWYQSEWRRCYKKTGGPMNEEFVRKEISGFARHAKRHGVAFDFFCLDDNWDGEWAPETGIWGRLAPSRFPGGLPALQAAAGKSGLGLWLSPMGGYNRLNEVVAWAKANQYEINPDNGRLCSAGDRYRTHLLSAIEQWIKAGVRYWKFDGIYFNCQDPAHGHPVGNGGRVAQIDLWIDLLRRIRTISPEIVIAFTSGSHPSPWWLKYADYIWRGGGDEGTVEGPGSRHDKFSTYIDEQLSLLRATAFPPAFLVTFALVQTSAISFKDDNAAPAVFERNLWLMVARGVLHHDLYIEPDSLDPEEWTTLARVLTWARARRRILARSRMILGDPKKREVYGFGSFREGHGILCLRNPGPAVQAVSLSLQTAFALDSATGSFRLTRVAGESAAPEHVEAGATLTFTLQPWEVLLIEAARV